MATEVVEDIPPVSFTFFGVVPIVTTKTYVPEMGTSNAASTTTTFFAHINSEGEEPRDFNENLPILKAAPDPNPPEVSTFDGIHGFGANNSSELNTIQPGDGIAGFGGGVNRNPLPGTTIETAGVGVRGIGGIVLNPGDTPSRPGPGVVGFGGVDPLHETAQCNAGVIGISRFQTLRPDRGSRESVIDFAHSSDSGVVGVGRDSAEKSMKDGSSDADIPKFALTGPGVFALGGNNLGFDVIDGPGVIGVCGDFRRFTEEPTPHLHADKRQTAGLIGASILHHGVMGTSRDGNGIDGTSQRGIGVNAFSSEQSAVRGECRVPPGVVLREDIDDNNLAGVLGVARRTRGGVFKSEHIEGYPSAQIRLVPHESIKDPNASVGGHPPVDGSPGDLIATRAPQESAYALWFCTGKTSGTATWKQIA